MVPFGLVEARLKNGLISEDYLLIMNAPIREANAIDRTELRVRIILYLIKLIISAQEHAHVRKPDGRSRGPVERTGGRTIADVERRKISCAQIAHGSRSHTI